MGSVSENCGTIDCIFSNKKSGEESSLCFGKSDIPKSTSEEINKMFMIGNNLMHAADKGTYINQICDTTVKYEDRLLPELFDMGKLFSSKAKLSSINNTIEECFDQSVSRF